MCALVTFLRENIFVFFFFFELSLIPTLWLILGWGFSPERLQAGAVMMFYTVCASIPFLLILVYTFLKCRRARFLLIKISSLVVFNWEGKGANLV